MDKRILYGPIDTQDFVCIASKCEENCCSNWNIDIDKKTYQKYKTINEEWFKQIFSASVIKHFILKRTKASYARITLNEKRECAFLNQDKLCNLHAKYGSESLSSVCNQFPKITNQLDDKLERSMSLACPEAARNVLLKKEETKYVQYDEDMDVPLSINKTISSKKYLMFNKHIKYLHELRKFQSDLVLMKNYSIWERLLFSADFYKNFEEYINKGGELNVPDFISQYNEGINVDKLKIIKAGSHEHRVISIGLLKNIYQQLNNYRRVLPNYEECYNQSSEALGLEIGNENWDENAEDFLKRYEELYQKYLQPFIKENGYFLENYIQNLIFRDVVPFQIFVTVFNAFSVFCVFYSLVICHLVGMAAYNKGLTLELAIKTIYSFSKAFNHNDSLNKIIFLELRMKRMNTLGIISGLLNWEDAK